MNESAGFKKLIRPRDERMIAGVAGGFARYLGIDPTLARLGLVALTFTGGIGIALYVAGWIMMPDEETAGVAASNGPITTR